LQQQQQKVFLYPAFSSRGAPSFDVAWYGPNALAAAKTPTPDLANCCLVMDLEGQAACH
jgi:hypothetical protein